MLKHLSLQTKPQMGTKMMHSTISVHRLIDNPIIHSDLDASIGNNIQGPSLIKVPDWVQGALGKYYLYFADHKGSYIRLAYADSLIGPWRIYQPGSLALENSHFLTEAPEISSEQLAKIEANRLTAGIKLQHSIKEEITTPHIASPDVHVDEKNQRILMYFHGLEGLAHQVTRLAVSSDGIHFEAQPDIIGRTYFRAFNWQGFTYGLAMPGQFYRSRNPEGPFEQGPLLFNKNMRHAAVMLQDSTLNVFWTEVGDAPEHIKLSKIDLANDWALWSDGEPIEILRPERSWEGAEAPLTPSVRSVAYGTVNQLRDPAIFIEGNETFLLYAVAGESGIAIAELKV
jgi:hypothetical protein